MLFWFQDFPFKFSSLKKKKSASWLAIWRLHVTPPLDESGPHLPTHNSHLLFRPRRPCGPLYFPMFFSATFLFANGFPFSSLFLVWFGLLGQTLSLSLSSCKLSPSSLSFKPMVSFLFFFFFYSFERATFQLLFHGLELKYGKYGLAKEIK